MTSGSCILSVMATKRTWTIGALEDEQGGLHPDQEALGELLTDLMGTLRAVGGQFIVGAQRMEAAPGSDEGITVGYKVMWQAFVPMARSQAPATPDEPMPHEEPVEEQLEPVEA